MSGRWHRLPAAAIQLPGSGIGVQSKIVVRFARAEGGLAEFSQECRRTLRNIAGAKLFLRYERRRERRAGVVTLIRITSRLPVQALVPAELGPLRMRAESGRPGQATGVRLEGYRVRAGKNATRGSDKAPHTNEPGLADALLRGDHNWDSRDGYPQHRLL